MDKKYTIYAYLLNDVTKKLDKLAKTAAKYGKTLSYTVGEMYYKKINVQGVDHIQKHLVDLYETAVKAVDISISMDGLICADGWTVLAKLEHQPSGENLVYSIGGAAIDKAWYSLPPHCDHCGTNRKRNVTYMVSNEAGDIRQVGKSCLMEYTGINPAWVAINASVVDILEDSFSAGGAGGYSSPIYQVKTVIACAIDAIAENGYRKSSHTDSTKNRVSEMLPDRVIPDEKSVEKAEKIIDYLKNIDISTASDFSCNLSVIAKGTFCEPKHIGFLAYAPVMYDKEISEKEKRLENAKNSASEFVGEVGKRITIEMESAELVTSFENQWATTYVYKFLDKNGNVYTWFASSAFEITGIAILVTGTVKAHKEYNGENQTILTRCKIK